MRVVALPIPASKQPQAIIVGGVVFVPDRGSTAANRRAAKAALRELAKSASPEVRLNAHD